MKVQLIASPNLARILKKYIKKSKSNVKSPNKFMRKGRLYAKHSFAQQGRFVCANVKYVKTPENHLKEIGKTNNIKFMITEINSLSNFNKLLQNPIKRLDKPQNEEQIALEKKIEQCSLDSDFEETSSLACCEQLPSIEDSSSCKTRNLMDVFQRDYIKKTEKNSDDFMQTIMKIECEYKVTKDYFKDFHTSQFNHNMRAILIDWLFEVGEDFKLKRDTLYEAVNILDRFFQSKSKLIQKHNLQGLGITALHIAAKKEEIYPPKLKDLVDLCGEQFDQKKILEFELGILQKIHWKLHPITMNFWLNYCVHQWDEFVGQNRKNYSLFGENTDLFMFLNQNADSFINYRIISSNVDATQLDLESFAFESKILINAFIYLLISSNIGNSNNYARNSWGGSEETITHSKNEDFDEIFNEFLVKRFQTNIDEVFTALNYADKFVKLPMNFQVCSENFDRTTSFDFQKNYNHNLSFQIYNNNCLEYVRNIKN